MDFIKKFKEAGTDTIAKKFDNSSEPKIKIIDNQFYKIIDTNKSSIEKSGIIFLEPMTMEYAKKKRCFFSNCCRCGQR